MKPLKQRDILLPRRIVTQRALNMEQLYHPDALSQIPATIPFACSLNNFIFQLKEVSKTFIEMASSCVCHLRHL